MYASSSIATTYWVYLTCKVNRRYTSTENFLGHPILISIPATSFSLQYSNPSAGRSMKSATTLPYTSCAVLTARSGSAVPYSSRGKCWSCMAVEQAKSALQSSSISSTHQLKHYFVPLQLTSSKQALATWVYKIYCLQHLYTMHVTLNNSDVEHSVKLQPFSVRLQRTIRWSIISYNNTQTDVVNRAIWPSKEMLWLKQQRMTGAWQYTKGKCHISIHMGQYVRHAHSRQAATQWQTLKDTSIAERVLCWLSFSKVC